MNKSRALKIIVRLILFTLILTLGSIVALVVDETAGLALADLPDRSIETLTTTAQGNVIYLGAVEDSQSSGIYRSVDKGRTWQMVGGGPNAPINTLAVHPEDKGILYAGGPGGPMETVKNLWRSKDSGQYWHKYNLNLPANPNGVIPDITALAIDPEQPETLYVGTDGHGVYRMEEGRIGYELVGGTSMYNGHVRDLVVAPNSRLYALTTSGLFVTEGDTWQAMESLPEFATRLVVSPANPQTLYVGSASSGLYRSTDGGQTWEPLNNGLEMPPGAALRITALTLDEQNPNHLAIATAYGLGSRFGPGHIYESHNGGGQWSKVAELDSLVTNLTVGDGLIHAITENGLRQYGQVTEPAVAEPTPVTSLSELRPLIDPSGRQLLILVLTLALAGLALLAPVDWVFRREQRPA